jgi:conjugal transfer pilus assembly protein TraD
MPASPGGWRCSISWGRRTGTLPRQLALPLALVCFAMGVLRVTQALRMLVLRASLGGRIEVVGTDDLARWCQDPASVFLGFGFEWQPVHSQRLYELAKIDYREFAVSPRLLQLLGYDSKPQPDAEIGLPYIHGVEPKEVPLAPAAAELRGRHAAGRHHPVRQGRGTGQPDHPGDPARRRGDRHRSEEQPAPEAGRRARLRRLPRAGYLHGIPPGLPGAGVRLDFTFNWQKPTEIASRIQSIMPPDTAGAFSAFGWDAVNVVVQGLVEIEERPNLMKLTKYIEGGIEPVLEGRCAATTTRPSAPAGANCPR